MNVSFRRKVPVPSCNARKDPCWKIEFFFFFLFLEIVGKLNWMGKVKTSSGGLEALGRLPSYFFSHKV